MNDMLKGNFKVKKPVETPKEEPKTSLESELEASALQKLGGSICFVKKSASFVWKGK